MNNQEILDNAPEGATHVMGGNCYCMENTEDDYSEDGYDYLTFRNEDTSGRHRSLADIKRIAELEKPKEFVRVDADWVYVKEKDIHSMVMRIAGLKKDISIAAKIMIDITNAQTVTDEGYSVGYLVTNKMMNGLDAFISKALKEQG